MYKPKKFKRSDKKHNETNNYYKKPPIVLRNEANRLEKIMDDSEKDLLYTITAYKTKYKDRLSNLDENYEKVRY